MLPEAVTTSLGLGLQEVSPALSFGLRLDAEGGVAEVEVLRTWVRARRVTYAEVDTRLSEPPFAELWAFAEGFRNRRRVNGAAALEFPEVSIRVRDGEVSIQPLPRLRSRTLVAECMLMAGAGVARFALEHEIPFPFSTQPQPDGPLQVDTPAAMFAARKKLKRRQMKTAPAPHAGLGLDAYAQVTSPLRRYLDLVAHQQLRAHLRGEPLLAPPQILERIGATEAMLGTLRRAEQYSNKHWTLVYLQRHPDWRGEGLLVDRRGQQATVSIPALALEAQVQLTGPGRLDDTLPLVLTGVDLSTLEARFRVDR
jgi:exoribonuclease-2